MTGIGVPEMLLFSVFSTIVTLIALYFVIRYAVRDGMVDAQRKVEAERVRAQLGLGPERSPNSRS